MRIREFLKPLGWVKIQNPLSYSPKRGIITTGRDQNLLYTQFKENRARTENLPKILRIGVQGAGFDRGQRKPGVENGPDIVRSSGFVDFLKESVGHDIIDYGNLNFELKSRKQDVIGPSRLRNLADVAKATKIISHSSRKIIEEGRICLTIGGDHSIAIGTINGVSEALDSDLAVLWIDAHTDINTTSTSASGSMHGMPLSFLIKEMQRLPFVNPMPEFSWVTPRIAARRLAYIGLRSVDPAERAIIDRLGITAFNMRDVDRYGIVEVTQRALDKITAGSNRPCHVSFDIDALDDLEVGNTGTPGGLTLREGMTILEEVYDNVNVVSMDLVEVNPSLGDSVAQSRTATLAKHLIGSAFGYCRGGTLKPRSSM